MKSQGSTANSQRLHLCDFDGTLTKGDSFVRFLLFAVPLPQLAVGGFELIFKFLGLIFSGKWSNAAGKAAVLSEFFKGKTVEELEALGSKFCQQKMPTLLRAELLGSLRQVLKNGETVVVVSASPDLWLRPFCAAEGFELLCTELEFVGGQFTGKFATLNCNWEEKARRIQAAYNLGEFEKVIAYGNSIGDAAMFALADEVFRF
ncbi:MAG: haloacid dehalogenase-like hydrolase [Phycisphaerae bacterium]|nr:haloacid dehalogenase-like hydrolase [Saprospiraceae bacterium]